jgi:ACT domain-containing protein
MLEWLMRSKICRINKIEAEVVDLRLEIIELREQNKVMISYIENINNYEKQLIETIEMLAKEVYSIAHPDKPAKI